MIRKFVKPALPGASIPDPARGRDLPQDGQPVVWNAHWARMERRGDIEVSELPEAPAPEAATESEAPAEVTAALEAEPVPEETDTEV